ncbi:hypothetical protein LguiA_015838 [Lonicera macranthoides]
MRPSTMQIIPPEAMDTGEEIERESLEKVEEEEEEEEVDDSNRIQPWRKQVTFRSIISSILIGSVYSVIATKMNLTTGITPNLNVSAALVAFVFMRVWTKVVKKAGILSTPFTRQENTMIQTCSVACYSIAVAGLRFYFDFSMTYVGTGMICSHNVNLSLLFGAVISWGLMWPLIGNLKGDWFPADLPESSMKSLGGYRSFISIALILGDGLYNLIKILYFTSANVHGRLKHKNINSAADSQNKTLNDLKQNEIFTKETIPLWVGASGYILFAIIAVIAIPFIFPELKWYYVIIAYILAPSLAFCNAYGAGLTDFNMAYNYGKVALFMLAALGGKEHGVVAGLAGCGLIKSIVSVSCVLMQDLKTSHLTLTSPRAMLINQAVGTVIGCVVAPLSFLMFYKAFDVGNPNGEFKAPYAIIYRNMAILGVQGFSALPHHCLELCYGFFAFAVGINLARDFLPPKIGKWMPLPMAMGVPFILGGYFAIDMCVGTLVVFVWHKLNPNKAELMVPAVASGLICGEGLWILPSSILALAKIRPPICMKFLSS